MARLWLLLLALGLLLGCATTEGTSRPDEGGTAGSADVTAPPPPPTFEQPDAPPAAEAPAEEAAATPPAEAPAEEQAAAEAAAEEATDEDAPVEDPDKAPPPPGLSGNGGANRDFEDGVRVATAEPDKALSLFQRAAEADPGFILAWHNAGVAAERQGKADQAVGFYGKALALRPDYYPSLYSLVQLQIRRGKLAEARGVARRALGQKRSAATLTVSGAVALASGKPEDAARDAKLALKADEKSVPAMLVLAEAFYAQKKYELTRYVLNNAREIEPRNALIHQALGRAFLALDNRPAAVRSFEEAVSIRQDLVESYNNLAVLYYETGDYTGAMAASRHAVEQAPRMPEAWINHGNALRAQQQYPQAIEAYEKAATLPGASPVVAYNLGILYLDNAVGELDEIQRMDKAMGYLKDFKGRSRMDAKQAERVEEYLTLAQRNKDRELKRREREAKRKAREEARKKREEEERLKAEAEAKRQAEEEAARLKAEEEARLKAEAEAKRKAEEEAKRQAEEEAKRKAEEEARQKALEEARSRKLGGGGK